MEPFALLVTLSRKRLAMIDEDPEIVHELVEARDDGMPGFLNLGTQWRALARIVGTKAMAAVTGQGGRDVEVDLGTDGLARILSAEQVATLSTALPHHGDEDPDMVEQLEELRALYSKAAKAGEAMLVTVVAE